MRCPLRVRGTRSSSSQLPKHEIVRMRCRSLRFGNCRHVCSLTSSDDDSLSRLSALVQQERRLTVAVLVHLAEVERRGLHLVRGCSSLFAYCVQRLGFSEDVAYTAVCDPAVFV